MRERRLAAAMIAVYLAMIIGAGIHLYLHSISVCSCPLIQ